MSGVWTADQTDALIELYRGHPILFNAKDPNYHNKYARDSALQSIIVGLQDVRPQTTAEEVKAKINAMRARFNLEMTKLRNKPSGSSSDMYRITFTFFEKLMFLKDHITSRKSYNNDTQGPSCSSRVDWVEDIKIELEDHPPSCKSEEEELASPQCSEESGACEEDIITPTSTNTFSSRGRGEKRSREERLTLEDMFLSKAAIALDGLNTLPKDEWDDFGAFLASSIRKLGSRKKMIACKHKMLQVLMQIEEEES